MATINFEHQGSRVGQGGKGGGATASGINTASIPGFVTNQRVVTVTRALSSVIGVSEGVYEHSGEDASGNWTYRKTD
jgi:hypothetical protein